jgi:hypothetical protein
MEMPPRNRAYTERITEIQCATAAGMNSQRLPVGLKSED